jgi:hypothetical protein
MDKAEKLFHEIGAGIPDTKESKMFGALCIKAANGKAGVMFWRGDMIVKLSAEPAADAMKLKGVKIFEPMDGRPMGGWLHLPAVHAEHWKDYAAIAMNEVSKIDVSKKLKRS